MQSSADRETARWYILTYTGTLAHAIQRLSAVKNLQFYAPEFHLRQNNVSRRDSWMFRNYAFVFGSQNKIYKLKECELQDFNFMRSRIPDSTQHPFITQLELEQLQKVEQMNYGSIPLTLSTDDLIIGDKIEILSGDYKGYTATAVTRSRSKFRQIYLFISDIFIIPLCKLTKQEFRIISYANPEKKISDFSLSAADATLLVTATRHFHGIPLTTADPHNPATADPHNLTTAEPQNLTTLITFYENQKQLTINNRLKLQSLLALCYMITGDIDKSLTHLKLAEPILQEKVTKVARLFHATLRYLSTTLPDHYNDFKLLKPVAKNLSSTSPLLQFITCADDLHTHLDNQTRRNTTAELFTGSLTIPYWFCLSAPKTKTEAIRLFRDNDIPIYAPVVSDGKKDKDQKNILKDLFFVRTTYHTLVTLRDEHRLFTILTHTVNDHPQVVTYTDDAIQSFDYVNTLPHPHKQLLHYTPREEQNILKSRKKTITLNNHPLQGHLMTIRTPTHTHQKLVFLLPSVAAIAIQIDNPQA